MRKIRLVPAAFLLVGSIVCLIACFILVDASFSIYEQLAARAVFRAGIILFAGTLLLSAGLVREMLLNYNPREGAPMPGNQQGGGDHFAGPVQKLRPVPPTNDDLPEVSDPSVGTISDNAAQDAQPVAPVPVPGDKSFMPGSAKPPSWMRHQQQETRELYQAGA